MSWVCEEAVALRVRMSSARACFAQQLQACMCEVGACATRRASISSSACMHTSQHICDMRTTAHQSKLDHKNSHSTITAHQPSQPGMVQHGRQHNVVAIALICCVNLSSNKVSAPENLCMCLHAQEPATARHMLVLCGYHIAEPIAANCTMAATALSTCHKTLPLLYTEAT